MILFLCSIVVATAAGVTAFLLLVSGDFKKFRESFGMNIPPEKPQKQLPLVTRDGQIIDTKEELEAQLEVLQYNLQKKKSELDSSRSRIFETANNLKKLKNTSAEIKKYYARLAGEIDRYERDCQQLQQDIDDYKKRCYDIDKKGFNYDSLENILAHFKLSSLPTNIVKEDAPVPVKTQSLH